MLAFALLGLTSAFAQSTDETCAGVLVTMTPSSVEGDQTAVAIVTQQLDADTPGWAQVSWEAAADTTLTGVTVQTETQTYTLIDDVTTGSVENALRLTFCGTATANGDGGTEVGEPEPDGDDLQVTQPLEEPCTDVLVTFTPSSVEGDQTAVAIVTQQLDADTPGWAQVSWEAAADTTLTGVTVQTETQTYTLIDDLATGSVENALRLTFCGTLTADTDGDTPPEQGTGNDTVVAVPDPADQSPTGPGDTPQGAGSADGGAQSGGGAQGGSTAPTDDNTAGDVPDDADDADDAASSQDTDQDEQPAPDVSSTDDEPQDEVTEADDDTDQAEDDTEVLGVQLNQEDDGGWGWQTPTLIVLILAAAIGAGVLVRNYYVSSQGGRP